MYVHRKIYFPNPIEHFFEQFLPVNSHNFIEISKNLAKYVQTNKSNFIRLIIKIIIN